MYLLVSKVNLDVRMLVAPCNTKEINRHIYNFIISYNLVAMIPFIWLMMGLGLRLVTRLAIIVIIINIFTELFVTTLHSPDIIDAYHGIAGTLFGFILISAIKRNRLKIYQSKKI
jgi:hypothetical protein